VFYYAFRLHNSFIAQLYHTSFSYMFRPHGAIFSYVGAYTIIFLFLATHLRLASAYTLGVRGIYGLCLPFFVKYIGYWDA
jgi:hypothetical protein